MRIILHVDMNYFFAQIEERENPELKGKAVVVGADPKSGQGRGVVSTANYAARQFGVKSGIPISRAWRFCRSLCVFLPVRYELYFKVSERIMGILREKADQFEQTSVDEAYLDISSLSSWERAVELAAQLKEEIKTKERLTCSIGIGPNKLIAKIASGFKKPDGLTLVKTNAVHKFLDSLPVIELPGIGPKTSAQLNRLKIKTIKDLRQTPAEILAENFGGRTAEWMGELSRGIDESPLIEERIPKSVGRQVTFERDTRSLPFLRQALMELVRDSYENMRAEGFFSYQTVTVICRYEDFETHSRQKTLDKPGASLGGAEIAAWELFLPFYKGSIKKIRLLGFSFSKLE